jgi:hypothetical protein
VIEGAERIIEEERMKSGAMFKVEFSIVEPTKTGFLRLKSQRLCKD